MLGPAFSLANLQDVAAALYGRQWQAAMARDLSLPERTVKGWTTGSPDCHNAPRTNAARLGLRYRRCAMAAANQLLARRYRYRIN